MEWVIEKGKSINKGTDKHYVADPLIHSTPFHAWCLYQVSKSYVK